MRVPAIVLVLGVALACVNSPAVSAFLAPIQRVASRSATSCWRQASSTVAAQSRVAPRVTAAVVMMAGLRKGGKQPQRGDRNGRETGDSPGNVYEYAAGGFEVKEMPRGMGSKDGMYEEFDMALRAASHNMFCSPLKPVQTPASFKAEQEALSAKGGKGGLETRKAFQQEEAEESPEETRMRLQKEYAELDRLIQGDTRAASANGKLTKLQQMSGKYAYKSKAAAPAAEAAAVNTSHTAPFQNASALPRRDAATSASPSPPRGAQKKRKARSSGMGLDLSAQLQGFSGSANPDKGREASDEELEIQEGYDDLQRLLGLKGMGGSKRQVDLNPKP